MKVLLGLFTFCLLVFAPAAEATEYALQFTPNPGYKGLVVAGYGFEGVAVVGNCSYYTVSGGSIKHYAQTCRWDMQGNLLSVTPGAPAIPLPKSINGTQVVYAGTAEGYSTGIDLALPERGFVDSAGPRFTWLASQNSSVLDRGVYTLTATLKSDGDQPLNITAVTPSALHGTVTLKETSCMEQPTPGRPTSINVGDTCSISVAYDDTKLTSPIGLELEVVSIRLTSDAGEAHDFTQTFTVVLPKK